eukprot:Sspe_Gene.81614::Locus_52528_Transcript_1_1_Confidence_1.000_Length_1147::g.81614::m.81614
MGVVVVAVVVVLVGMLSTSRASLNPCPLGSVPSVKGELCFTLSTTKGEYTDPVCGTAATASAREVGDVARMVLANPDTKEKAYVAMTWAAGSTGYGTWLATGLSDPIDGVRELKASSHNGRCGVLEGGRVFGMACDVTYYHVCEETAPKPANPQQGMCALGWSEVKGSCFRLDDDPAVTGYVDNRCAALHADGEYYTPQDQQMLQGVSDELRYMGKVYVARDGQGCKVLETSRTGTATPVSGVSCGESLPRLCSYTPALSPTPTLSAQGGGSATVARVHTLTTPLTPTFAGVSKDTATQLPVDTVTATVVHGGGGTVTPSLERPPPRSPYLFNAKIRHTVSVANAFAATGVVLSALVTTSGASTAGKAAVIAGLQCHVDDVD